MDAAEVYKNNPTVLFGILNEPHSINWANWRDGGQKRLMIKAMNLYQLVIKQWLKR